MGNTTSSTSNSRPSPGPTRRIDSPGRRQPQSHSPSPNPNQPHRSLRTKKKSLELPDLALLSLTPANSHHNSANSSPLSSYRRPPRTTSPIPIPIPVSNNGTMNNASNTGTSPRGRQPNVKANTTRETDTSNYSSELLLDQPPSTHIPVHNHHRPRGGPYFRGAPLQYNSTHSFASRGQSAAQPRMQELYAESQIETSSQPDQHDFVQETVHSTIPLALHKAEEDFAAAINVGLEENGQPIPNRPALPFDEPKEPVNVKISWHGGGKSVVLARAGDDNWKGRQPMEPDDPPADASWSIWVALMPGTHHIRFIVDEQWRVADDLPTAVDDEGTLANYVAVPISGLTPPHATVTPATPAKHPIHPHVHSFWSSTTSTHGSMADVPSALDPIGSSSKWTDDIPAELVAAAREEEAYLAYTAAAEYDQSGSVSSQQLHVPAPNIPPAPVLPRHLDKLILNVKVGQLPPSTRGHGPGLTDDGSVLPVPSHVVLHHLSTSAIRNGVLAVGNTTRYRQKYLTTIYYKPT
ncbi:carbohydrate-binding module family 48 protein [Hydnomerulius pinastri MD-312]|uniref:Carbohydrate-binding module family 48 protein n=1 Tax=Hydnomerulius pinastri MD-312 TaxID=994086 RepID=A0A0C9W0U9_9AGAM|nr:carbohydrate-binding module family 48 protein [Hydnomerulius pinastri MD-312]